MTSSVALLLVLAAATYAFPQFAPAGSTFHQFAPARQVPQVTFRSHQLDDAGQFSSSVQGSDGQLHQESGVLKPTADGKGLFLAYTGNYKYISPEGIPVEIHYVADENGFRPTGNVIPVAPTANVPTF